MIYRVLMDGLDIYDARKDMILLSPTVSMELNTAGTFDFTIPPSHLFYDEIKLMKSTIEVYEDEELIFFGRPSEIKKGWLNQKVVHCEGALAYLNDVVLRPQIYSKITIASFFRNVIERYNELTTNDKKFTVGNVTVENRYVDREISYQTPFDVLSNMCLATVGGYIFIRKTSDAMYIDWLKDMPYSSDQPIQFGVNLLDISSDLACSDIASIIVPLGDKVTDPSTGIEMATTIASVNDGKDYLEIPVWEEAYGLIERVVEFSGIDEPSELLTAAQNYIAGMITDILVIECDAADLHFHNDEFHQFKVGQTVSVSSTPHNINVDLPLTKIDVDISTAVKKIRIGTPPRDGISSMSSVN